MNAVKQYFERLFMTIRGVAVQVQNLDNTVARIEKKVNRKTKKTTSKAK